MFFRGRSRGRRLRAIAEEIVELHGGSIRAESESESITFTVRLPVG